MRIFGIRYEDDYAVLDESTDAKDLVIYFDYKSMTMYYALSCPTGVDMPKFAAGALPMCRANDADEVVARLEGRGHGHLHERAIASRVAFMSRDLVERGLL